MTESVDQDRSATARQDSTLVRWTRIFSAYFAAQSGAQLLSLLAGLVFIRFMPVADYALYTLAAAVIGFFTFASDLGSTSSLVYFFHRSKSESEAFGPYRESVLSLRRWAFLLGAVAVVSLFPPWATAEGFTLGQSLAVAAAVLATVWFQIVSSVRLLDLRLGDQYGRSYRAEVVGAGVRLVLALAVVGVASHATWLAVTTSAAALAMVAFLARPAAPEARTPAASLAPYRRRVLRYLLPTLPSALYFSLQAPLVVWLAATFGAARNVAEVGALGRLGMIVNLFSNLTTIVFLPRLARITDDRLYRQRALQFAALLAAVALALVASAALLPDLYLLLLGEKYAGLDRELLLVVAGAGITLLGGFAVGLNAARSWNRWQTAAVALLIAAQAAMVATLPLATTQGVLLFNLLTAVVGLLLQVVTAAVGFWRPRWVHW